MKLDENELNLIREWFDCAEDLCHKYLREEDYVLANRIYQTLGVRVPNSILRQLEMYKQLRAGNENH